MQTPPSPDPVAAGPGRTGALLDGANYTDFYLSVDVIDWDDTTHQAFGILARVTNPEGLICNLGRMGSPDNLERAMPEVVAPTKARRLKLAEQLIAHGRVSKNPKHPMTYHVSALDNRHAYVVCLTGPQICTCRDTFYRRVHCKHYLAASLVHIETVARHEEQQVSAKIACADCRSQMPATEPCPSCRHLVCDKCFDSMSGVCLGCPGGE